MTEFTFTSSNGKSTIYARKFLPEGTPRGIVQIAHGIAEHIGRYEEFMKFLAGKGFVAAANDHIGHGQSVASDEELGLFDEKDGWDKAVEDMDKLHDIMREEFPDIPYIFFGHSMGSYLLRTYLIRHPEKADLAILSGTGGQLSPVVAAGLGVAETTVRVYGARKISKLLLTLSFGSYNNGYDEPRTEFDWLSSVPEVPDAYIADPKCGFPPTAGLFRDLFYGIMYDSDKDNLVKMNKDMPVLMISGWKDPVGENGKGVKRVFRMFCEAGMKHVHLKLYPNCRHELLNETNKHEVMDDIAAWIDKSLLVVEETKKKAAESGLIEEIAEPAPEAAENG